MAEENFELDDIEENAPEIVIAEEEEDTIENGKGAKHSKKKKKKKKKKVSIPMKQQPYEATILSEIKELEESKDSNRSPVVDWDALNKKRVIISEEVKKGIQPKLDSNRSPRNY